MPIWTAPSQRADQRPALVRWRAARARMAAARGISQVRPRQSRRGRINGNGPAGREGARDG